MALWFFNKVVWFVLAAMLEGILLPSNMAAKTTFCLDLVKRLIVTLRCAVNVQKEVIHNFKNHILVTWPATNLLILRKWCGFEKPNHYFLRLRYDPRIIFRRQNYITFIFIKTMSHDLLGQMAYFHLHFNKLINTAQ